jgi:predicted transcriptional regulator
VPAGGAARHRSKKCVSGNKVCYVTGVAEWSFLTNHARVLLRIAQDPGARLRDIAAAVGITERSAYGIVTDLTAAGYVVKHKDGRRNSYQIQAHLPLPEPASQEPAIGDVLALLIGDGGKQGLAKDRPDSAP